MKTTLTLLLTILSFTVATAQTQITTAQAADYVGSDVIVTGVVIEKSYIESLKMAEYNLFLGDNFSIDLYGDDVLLCGDDVLDYIKPGSLLSVHGTVERLERGGNVAYRIVLDNCKQFISF
jgi:hypothetical protein